MASRLELHAKLVEILGSSNVYFQPPQNLVMKYPCITYQLTNILDMNADNIKYKSTKSYTVTLIHKDPDNDIVDKLNGLRYCTFDRSFCYDNLNHYVYTLYF